MFSRISGVTEGLVANCDIGSPGASARMAKITRLITSSVGMASKLRRKIYWLIGFPYFIIGYAEALPPANLFPLAVAEERRLQVEKKNFLEGLRPSKLPTSQRLCKLGSGKENAW